MNDDLAEKELLTLASSLIPDAKFNAITYFHDLDVRVGIVNIHFVNIIGVGNGFLEFCPNESPASEEELLAFLWIVRPDLGKRIAPFVKTQTFRNAILEYKCK